MSANQVVHLSIPPLEGQQLTHGGFRAPAQTEPAMAPPRRIHQRTGPFDVTCHNCLEEGQYSTNFPHPQVSYKRKSANRAKLEGISGERLPQQAQQSPQIVHEYVGTDFRYSGETEIRFKCLSILAHHVDPPCHLSNIFN